MNKELYTFVLMSVLSLACSTVKKETSEIALKVSNALQDVYSNGIDVLDFWCTVEEIKCQRASQNTKVDVDCESLKLCKIKRIEFMQIIKKAQTILLGIDDVLTASDFLQAMDLINAAREIVEGVIEKLKESGVLDERTAQNLSLTTYLTNYTDRKR